MSGQSPQVAASGYLNTNETGLKHQKSLQILTTAQVAVIAVTTCPISKERVISRDWRCILCVNLQ